MDISTVFGRELFRASQSMQERESGIWGILASGSHYGPLRPIVILKRKIVACWEMRRIGAIRVTPPMFLTDTDITTPALILILSPLPSLLLPPSRWSRPPRRAFEPGPMPVLRF